MEKLIEIQSELKAPKNQRNNFGNYNYRSCEDILEAVKPLLKEKKCLLTLTDELVNIGQRYYIKATAIFNDGTNQITVTGFAREEETKKGMDGSQITGASSSYARKYALNALFLIDDQKDSDVTNQGEEKKPAKQNEMQNSELKIVTWMTDKQFAGFKEDLQSGIDLRIKRALRNYKGFSFAPYGMKREFKSALEGLIASLDKELIERLSNEQE